MGIAPAAHSTTSLAADQPPVRLRLSGLAGVAVGGRGCRTCRSRSRAGSMTACCRSTPARSPVEGVELDFQVEDNPRVIFDNMAGELGLRRFANSRRRNSSRGFVAGQCPFVASQCFRRGCSGTASSSSIASSSRARRTCRQADRRAGLHHDRGGVHPRAAQRRARHRLLQLGMGRGRHQQREAARQSDHPADREEDFRSAPTGPASR